MGRVKIAPTPRAAALNDAMRRAATQISPPTAEAVRNDLANTSKAGKQLTRNSLPTPRGSQDRATSEPTSKRKAASESKSDSNLPKKDTKLALRSSNKPPATPSAVVDMDDAADVSADGPPSKRQKVDEASPAPRRSTRTKPPKDDTTPPTTRPLRSVGRKSKKHSKIVDEAEDDQASTDSSPKPQEEVVALKQDIAKTETASIDTQSDLENAIEGSESFPSPTSATTDTQVMAVNATRSATGPRPRDATSLPPPSFQTSDQIVSGGAEFHPLPTTKLSSAPTTANDIPDTQNPSESSHSIPYTFSPGAAYVSTPADVVPVNGVHDPASSQTGQNGNVPPPNTIAVQGPPFPPGHYMLPHNFGHLATPVGANGQPLHFVPSRRGQKVKGRPPPKAASTSKSPTLLQASSSPDTSAHASGLATANASASPSASALALDAKNRALANTYPRKQPFKAQIEFPGYPPPNAEIPGNYTMWEICQLMPNALRENNLRAFVQREWSANELCACLKDDARAVLNARPGKDKTMVFQKRLERIKKDLVAKGEFEALVRAPPLREDGRPTWVKRGNVRRK
ncbi:uncharacterized protein HMPREF1541_03822 [Cyphellophora europaea CBS 101466]|uniref:Uncharacterized protein n=1 Tax=Cyphellophora europaea (strain CBS 101466) TaxID=1220924 RepID=W2S1H3_CYPE1|nr:uncharacterized protein HMPREF1541_03822 [Cyphellophora europaea CBS 101466]ETN41883.1 hypothetical protein HMPREF1541_03822 [Cyphellophora europaea CBS 101466]